MREQLMREFQNPGAAFRGKPFWAWNGKLEEGELRRQIRALKAMGMGGFFMHSRVGLATPYLAKEWFDMVGACVDEARKTGMEAWLYDEDRWPSGAAGGIVTKNPRHRNRSLIAEITGKTEGFKWDRSVIAAFTAKVDKECAWNPVRVRRGTKPRLHNNHSLVVFREVESPCSSWYNGYTYLDTMSREAVREFLRVTHEAYARKFQADFGKVIPGIFTDEPNYLDGKGLPWTADFPKVFRKRHGYDIAPKLMEVFFKVDGREVSQARWHYLDCATHMHADAFSRQIGEWCGRHGMAFTGHVLSEETPFTQTLRVGSAMRQLEHYQAPGMDLLTEFRREYDTAKQVSSVARQFGRKWRLTETYGCTGWDFSFAGHKALGDWQAALGINLRCQHLTWYTMEGEAKRDYPACIGYQSPWWQAYSKVEDYFARVGAAMSKGSEVRDLLVLYPVESVWAVLHAPWDWSKHGLVADLEKNLFAIRDSLLSAHIDYDYGDEDILARHGRVSAGAGHAELAVGKAKYKAVLVPPMTTIRGSTLALIEKFAARGGRVVFAEKPPAYVDALPSDKALRLAEKCVRCGIGGSAMIRALAPRARRVSICDGRGREVPSALYLLREDRDNFYLFVCNTGLNKGQIKPDISCAPVKERKTGYEEVFISGFAECRGKPQEWDTETGRIFQARAERDAAGNWRIATELPALGGRIFVMPKQKAALRAPKIPVFREKSARKLGEPESVALSEDNVLVLDFAEHRVGDGEWRKKDEILRVDRAVRDAIGLPHRGGHMCQPWARKPEANPKHAPVELRYEFNVKSAPNSPLCLAIERPERYAIEVNGRVLDTDTDAGWWTDRSLRRVPLDASLLTPGENRISIKCDYDAACGFEMMYLLGGFGVSMKGGALEITAQAREFRLGDLGRQGLPFYSGNVSYRYRFKAVRGKGERVLVRIPDYMGVAIAVSVDGKPAGVAAWPPHEADVTRFADGKPHELYVTLLGHRRNSHGPLHNTQKPMPWVGPGQFVTTGDWWSDDYVLAPFGLMRAPEVVVKKPVG